MASARNYRDIAFYSIQEHRKAMRKAARKISHRLHDDGPWMAEPTWDWMWEQYRTVSNLGYAQRINAE